MIIGKRICKNNLYFFGEIVGGCELGTGAAEVSQGLDRQPRVANHRHQTEGGVVCGVCICVFVFVCLCICQGWPTIGTRRRAV